MADLSIDDSRVLVSSGLFGKPKTPLKKPVKRPGRPFSFIRRYTDRLYNDPYQWGLMKCVAFFAAGVFVAKTLSQLDILPAEAPSSSTTQSAY